MSLLKNMFVSGLVLSSVCLASCGGNDAPAQSTFEVTVTNVTNGQPLTPLGVVIHQAGYIGWEEASSASVGLEDHAESGDPTSLLAAANNNNAVVGTGAGSAPFPPGSFQMVSVTVNSVSDLQISVSTMLANTNDAFTGVSNMDISSLAVGESITVMPSVYDAGTEANTETIDTMPGPVTQGLGEGFNPVRDDKNFISVHSGVVTSADGLTTSALDETHRWIGSAAILTVTRTQ